jgi:ABC-type glycerol-3-phosphate transport system permease component
VDTYAGLIIPGAVSVFGIFLFRQSFSQVPDDLLQAARIDGCSEFRIYWDVAMPVTRHGHLEQFFVAADYPT